MWASHPCPWHALMQRITGLQKNKGSAKATIVHRCLRLSALDSSAQDLGSMLFHQLWLETFLFIPTIAFEYRGSDCVHRNLIKHFCLGVDQKRVEHSTAAHLSSHPRWFQEMTFPAICWASACSNRVNHQRTVTQSVSLAREWHSKLFHKP